MAQPQTEVGKIQGQPLLQLQGEFVKFSRQINDRIEPLAEKIIEPGDNHPLQITGDVLGGNFAHGADQRVDEQYGLYHLDVEYPMGPDPDKA